MLEIVRKAKILSEARFKTKRIIKMGILFGLATGFVSSFAPSAPAAIINVSSFDSPNTNIAKIAGATAGDTVLIAPGTYEFCVQLTNSGTPGNPIVIKGSDPHNRPVFDLGIYENLNSGADIYYAASDWGLGSWDGGSWGAGAGVVPHNASGNWDRGAIVVWDAGYINIEDIEFINVHNTRGDANALRIHALGGPVNITRCKMTYCTNGIDVGAAVGASGDDVVTISYCEIGYSGRYPNQDPPGGHNFYTHGGTMVVEYCYIHHATEGQNLHLRNKAATFRYCWLESPYAYHMDMSRVALGQVPAVQTHTYIGNVFVDNQDPEIYGPTAHVFVIMEGNDMQGTPVPQRLNLYYNTFIGMGDSRYLVSFAGVGQYATYLPSLHMYNNIIWGNTRPTRDQYTGVYGTIDIRNNWWPTADYSAWSDYMSNNIFGSAPGFVDRAGGNYTLTESAQARSAANSSLGERPTHEYIYHLDGKLRPEWDNLGAFEYPQEYQAPLSGPVINIRPTP